MTSTVERTAAGAVITGFEYTYDDLSRIIEEKVLANSTKMCYTYDNLSRVTERTVKKLSDNSVVSTETFNYDAAGNVTSAPDSSFQYDTNNRLISFNGNAVSYDLDGNMLSNGSLTCTYDSANRLVSAGGYTYTYNAEDVRIRNLCSDEDTTYTYNTNAKLSMLLMKTTNGMVTKYVYGKGLIGEEVGSVFKTYHFDCRGSTIAITDASGNITDTFAYDTYGKLLTRTGINTVIFGYNGRDGVVTDDNGLIYMRARYYSPDMRRFINADIIAGKISNAVTLNRYAYANGNPVSNVDPFGLSVERGEISREDYEIFVEFMKQLFSISLSQNIGEIRFEGLYATLYQSINANFGCGPIDISSLLSGQIELLQSLDFSQGSFTQRIGTDILYGYDYSIKIDDVNSFVASITLDRDFSLSAEYTVTSNYDYDISLSTTTGVSIRNRNTPLPTPAPVPVPAEEKNKNFFDRLNEGLEPIRNGLRDVSNAFSDFTRNNQLLIAAEGTTMLTAAEIFLLLLFGLVLV